MDALKQETIKALEHVICIAEGLLNVKITQSSVDEALIITNELGQKTVMNCHMNSVGATIHQICKHINNKTLFNSAKSDVPRFLAMLKDNNVPAEYCIDLFSDWCSGEGDAVLAEKCMMIQSKHNVDMTGVWEWLCSNEPSPDTDWTKEVDRYKEAINGH